LGLEEVQTVQQMCRMTFFGYVGHATIFSCLCAV